MSEHASFDLDRGFSSPRDLVGKTLVHRPTRDIGFPLVAGLVYGLIAIGLLTAAFMTGLALSGGVILLVGLELAIGAGLGWLAVMMGIDLVTQLRFNRRRYEVRFGLERVEIDSVDGVEPVAFADVAAHPLLRSLAIDRRIGTLMRVRGACQQLVPDSEVRAVLETIALLYLEDEPESSHEDNDENGRTRPLYAVILRSGQVNVFQERDDPEDLDGAHRSGLPLYRVRTDWDPDSNSDVPRLTPAGVTRISGDPA